MGFLIDTQELKPGLIIFRRADVKHRNWYCRIKVPRDDRYKTVSLKTADIRTLLKLQDHPDQSCAAADAIARARLAEVEQRIATRTLAIIRQNRHPHPRQGRR